MLRKIQNAGDLSIWKSSNNKGETQFYGVRARDAQNSPWDITVGTLTEAREFCGVQIVHPVRETAPKSAYAGLNKGKGRGKR